MRVYEPQDLMIWLQHFDVNGLTDLEGQQLANVDIADDGQLEKLMKDWMATRYLEHNDTSKSEMREILLLSQDWTIPTLRGVFSQIQFPSGQPIDDIARFLNALRKAIL